jgi:hypothetical protein
MRDTDYATELARAEIGDVRIERLLVKALGQEEIRLSWWPAGHLANRPVDLPEQLLIELIAKGIQEGVLSPTFLRQLAVAVEGTE